MPTPEDYSLSGPVTNSVPVIRHGDIVPLPGRGVITLGTDYKGDVTKVIGHPRNPWTNLHTDSLFSRQPESQGSPVGPIAINVGRTVAAVPGLIEVPPQLLPPNKQ